MGGDGVIMGILCQCEEGLRRSAHPPLPQRIGTQRRVAEEANV